MIALSTLSRVLRGRKGRRIRRATGGLALACLLLIGTDLVAEDLFSDVLNEANQPPPEVSDGWAPTMRGNPYLLWEYAPGMRDEFGIPVHINSLGLRGPEPTIPKPAGVRRLLATGDSSVYGFGIEDGQAFIDVAADLLGEGVEGWNAAIPGYSTFQTLNLLELRALQLEPDVLVIGNVWSDNNFDSFVDRELLDAYSTWEGGWTGTLRQVLSMSAIFRLLDFKIRVQEGEQAVARKVGWTVGKGQQMGRRRVEVNDYARNLQRLVDLAHQHKAEAIIVLLASQDDLAASQDEPPAWELYRRIMRDTARRNGLKVVEAPQLFQSTGLERDILFLDEMHPTADGHVLLGKALAEALQGWAGGGPLESPGTGEERPTYTDPFVFGGTGPTKVAPTTSAHAPLLAIEGTVVLEDFRGGTLQVDGVIRAASGKVQVVGTSRLKQPGSFKLLVRDDTRRLGFVIYEDADEDGPSAMDRRFELEGRTWEVSAEGLTGIELVLQNGL